MDKILQMVDQLENLQDIGDLMKELIFDKVS